MKISLITSNNKLPCPDSQLKKELETLSKNFNLKFTNTCNSHLHNNLKECSKKLGHLNWVDLHIATIKAKTLFKTAYAR